LNLKPLRAVRWLPALMAATSPRMRGRCYECEHDGSGEDKHDGKKLLERLGAMETWS
jgi:hypothetical protein